MKKSELTQITQLIELIVAKEVRKQLPVIIAETFQNMMGGKTVVNESKKPTPRQKVQEPDPDPEQIEEEVQSDQVNFKSSLRELFAGTNVMAPRPQATRQPRQFAKDPILNQILNETTPDLRAREGLVGMAAFQGGYNPAAVASAAPMMSMEEGPEPSFMRNVPSMQPQMHRHVPQVPISKPPVLAEGQVSNHAPMAELPQGVSVLDVARTGAAPEAVTGALTRNYSQMMKLIDKKKGKVA